MNSYFSCVVDLLPFSLLFFRLVTGSEKESEKEQQMALVELKTSLKQHEIDFSYSMDQTLHDRDLQFDNGWVVRFGGVFISPFL